MAKTRRPGELPPLPQAAVAETTAGPPPAPFPPASSTLPVSADEPSPAKPAPPPAAAPATAATADSPTGLARKDAAHASSSPPELSLKIPTVTDPLVGTKIGDRYRILERIGSGGMASVYRAEHELLKKPVAVKILLPELAVDQDMAARFEREAIAAARLDHPNCVAITDFGRTPRGQMFIVMEYLDGRPLSEISGHGKRLPWERAVELTRQILRGLARAHDMGICHRDLKASNIMLVSREGGRDLAKIIDFGIAKLFDGSNAGPHVETKAGIVFGTADFLAPERLLGRGDTDPRADLYSVGVILYEMLTGSRPFHADDPYEIVRRALSEAPTPPRRVAPDAEIPPALEEVVLRALEKEPDDRFSSAREFLAALDEIGKRASSTTGYLAGDAAARRTSPGASAGAAPAPLLPPPFSDAAPAVAAAPVTSADVASADPEAPVGFVPPALGSEVAPPSSSHRPRRSVRRWAGFIAVPVLVIGVAVLATMGDDDPAPAATLLPHPLARAAGAESDREAEITRLVRQAAEGRTVEDRQSAFDRLVALGYVDRVPWVDKLRRDLEQLPTCEERRAVVTQLEKLKNPAALPSLEAAIRRPGNECLKEAARRAIAALGGTPPATASSTDGNTAAKEATTSPATSSTRRRSTGSSSSPPPPSPSRRGGGHF